VTNPILTPAPAFGASEATALADPEAVPLPAAPLAWPVAAALELAALPAAAVVLPAVFDEPPQAAVVSNAAPSATAAIGRSSRRENCSCTDMGTPLAGRLQALSPG